LSIIADQTFIEHRSRADLPDVNAAEIAAIKSIAQKNGDGPVLMFNLNKYRPEAGYPDGKLYTDYMAVLGALLPQVGEKVLWPSRVRISTDAALSNIRNRNEAPGPDCPRRRRPQARRAPACPPFPDEVRRVPLGQPAPDRFGAAAAPAAVPKGGKSRP
jgi:hypothetical protein